MIIRAGSGCRRHQRDAKLRSSHKLGTSGYIWISHLATLLLAWHSLSPINCKIQIHIRRVLPASSLPFLASRLPQLYSYSQQNLGCSFYLWLRILISALLLCAELFILKTPILLEALEFPYLEWNLKTYTLSSGTLKNVTDLEHAILWRHAASWLDDNTCTMNRDVPKRVHLRALGTALRHSDMQ
jgi:hypothetical protein